MTSLLHQLRLRSRALANGVLMVLLATWLSTVCQHCLAQAADESTSISHCQHAAPPADADATAAHNCCPQAAVPICDSGDCMQVSSVISSSEPLTVLVATSQAHALPPDDVFSHLYSTIPPPELFVVDTLITDACPRYLRNCVFRL